jgi:hypothetical protein
MSLGASARQPALVPDNVWFSEASDSVERGELTTDPMLNVWLTDCRKSDGMTDGLAVSGAATV